MGSSSSSSSSEGWRGLTALLSLWEQPAKAAHEGPHVLCSSVRIRQSSGGRPQQASIEACVLAMHLGHRQLAKARRADPVNSHIGTKSGMQTIQWTWHACNVDLREPLSAWLDLVHVSSVQVPGSVEEVRLSSRLASIKNERRERLEAEFECVLDSGNPAHLQLCCQSRLAAMPRQPHQPGTPVVIGIDSDNKFSLETFASVIVRPIL
eukprot:1156487-Pelagomonas_calceolata.AAC.5